MIVSVFGPASAHNQGNILSFIALYVVLMAGFGVARYTLTYPYRPWDDKTLNDVFFKSVITPLNSLTLQTLFQSFFGLNH